MQTHQNQFQFPLITSVDVSHKKVLLRTSLNAPVDAEGKPTGTSRLAAALPTIRHCAQQGAKVIIIAHLGREGQTLEHVVHALADLAPELTINFCNKPVAEAGDDVSHLQPGDVLVLENIRSNPGEESNDSACTNALAQLGDLYVNDAFADSHREHSSIVGVPMLLPSYIGLLMQKEIAHLDAARTPPPKSLAIIGGAKFETKEPVIQQVLQQYSVLLLGGALANDMFKARGMPFGSSKISDTPVPVAIAQDQRIFLPTDGIVFDTEVKKSREAYSNDIRATERFVDIGSKTAVVWSEHIMHAPFVMWNGPMGVYEEGYTQGTDMLAKALTESGARAVVGGGDTLDALAAYSFDEERVFLSTGGGAMLDYLAYGTLAGLEALKKSPSAVK